LVALIEVDLLPTVIAIGVWLTVSLTLVYYVRKLYRFATGKVEKIESSLEGGLGSQFAAELIPEVHNVACEILDAKMREYAPAMQKMMVATVEHLMPKLEDALYSSLGDSLTDVFQHVGAQEFGRQGGNAKVRKAQVAEGKKKALQMAIAQKFGPEAATFAAGAGLDEIALEAIEDNPELASLVMQKLQGNNQSRLSPPHISGNSTGQNWP